jgi:iron complex outermembrane recepter protein
MSNQHSVRLRARSKRVRSAASVSWIALALALTGPMSLATAAQAADPPAAAKSADKNNDKISEIVVTAEYRAENVQNTPISITAVDSKMLDQRGVTNIMDLANSIPNVSMRQGGSGSGQSNQVFIRGIGQGDFLFAYSPRIASYVDGVYFSTVYGSTFDLLDIDHIDVERGPQGVLSGRNAAGGAINIVSKKPTGDGSGYMEATGGSLSRFDIKGAIDETLVPDKLFLRLSGMHEQHDGWVKLDNFACLYPSLAGKLPNVVGNTGQGCQVGTLGAVNDWAVRGQLRWTPTEKIEDNLSLDYTNSHDTASPDVLTAPLQFDTLDREAAGSLTPVGFPNNVPLPNGLATWFGNIGGPDYGLPTYANTPANIAAGNCLIGTTAAFTPPARTYCLPTAALAAALYPHNPYVSYASFGNPGLSGSNPGAENLPGVPNYLDTHSNFADPNIYNLKQWGLSNTLDVDLLPNVHVKSITAWRGYSGVFGSSQAAVAVPIQEAYQGVSHHQFSEEVVFTGKLFNDRLDWTAGGFFLNSGERNTGRVDFEGFAFFGGPDVQDFYIDDPATLQNRSGFVDGRLQITDKLSIDAGVRYSSETKTYAFTRHYVFYQGLPDPTVLNVTYKGTSDSESKWTPRAVLQYQFTPQVMAYASYATGFTAGGINGRPFNTATDIFPYGPETVTSYEVGLKTALFNHRLRLNGDIFQEDYTNIQETQLGAACGCSHSTTVFFTANAGNARIRGFELEAEAHPFGGLIINASVGYNKFEYTSLLAGVSLSLSSPQLLAPSWTGSAGAQYAIDLGNLGTLTPRLDVNFQSTTYFSATEPNDPYAQQPGYAMVNARLTWQPLNHKWSVSGAVTNLGDLLYYTQKVDGRTGFGTAYGTVGEPREFTITVRRSF